MLDESLASLDVTMKEAAIKTIRENTNATVIIIMHDGIDGIFDDCIFLDENVKGKF
jgi:ABC-type Mn2+/Zn2+ transport system ATPase subunit